MLDYHKGTIISWNDERGFGFIEPEDKAKNVFVHISAFKGNGQRPKAGDVVYYQSDIDQQGRVGASAAYIEGIQSIAVERHQFSAAQRNDVRYYPRSKKSIKQPTFKQKYYRIESKDFKWKYGILFILGLITIGVYNAEYFSNRHHDASIKYSTNSTNSVSQKYTCSGKIRCSQMNSCEEATFYLRNCPGVEIDGDGDGIPCESQWCGH